MSKSTKQQPIVKREQFIKHLKHSLQSYPQYEEFKDIESSILKCIRKNVPEKIKSEHEFLPCINLCIDIIRRENALLSLFISNKVREHIIKAYHNCVARANRKRRSKEIEAKIQQRKSKNSA